MVILNIFRAISSIGKRYFYVFAAFASIVGVVCFFIRNEIAVIIAVSFFCLMLLVFTAYLIYTLFKIIHIRNKDQDFDTKSIFVKYECSDKRLIDYEVYKVIQCKIPMLSEVSYPFKWSGTHLPEISSKLQRVVNVLDIKDPHEYDKALLKLKRSLRYNESHVLHFKARMDDSDQKSSTHVLNKISYEVDIIHYRIILRYKTNSYCKPAILKRKRINPDVSSDFKKIAEIPFDKKTKSYEYHLLKPEVGYIYKISWDR